MPKAALLNDTSHTYHWGCTATSGAVRRQLAARGWKVRSVSVTRMRELRALPGSIEAFDDRAAYERFAARNPLVHALIEECDLVVINGEGTMHGLRPPSIGLLYCAWIAKRFLGRPVHILNHSCFPDSLGRTDDAEANAAYAKVYRAVDGAVVRDPLSEGVLRRFGVPVVPGFDSLPLRLEAALPGPRPRCDVALLACWAGFPPEAVPMMAALIGLLRTAGLAVEILIGDGLAPARDEDRLISGLDRLGVGGWGVCEPASLQAWFAALGEARLLVSGRFHHTIAAACLGTPYVLFGGNTPKNHGLAMILGEPPPLAGTADASEISARVRSALRRGPAPEAERRALLSRLCGLARRNYAALPPAGVAAPVGGANWSPAG